MATVSKTKETKNHFKTFTNPPGSTAREKHPLQATYARVRILRAREFEWRLRLGANVQLATNDHIELTLSLKNPWTITITPIISKLTSSYWGVNAKKRKQLNGDNYRVRKGALARTL